MKKMLTATALMLTLAIPGLALASGGALKPGEKVKLCEKQGAYSLLVGHEKCDGVKTHGKIKAIKDGKVEVDVKGKMVTVDEPMAPAAKTMEKTTAPAKADTKMDSKTMAPATAPATDKK